jgi:hypothetical protein
MSEPLLSKGIANLNETFNRCEHLVAIIERELDVGPEQVASVVRNSSGNMKVPELSADNDPGQCSPLGITLANEGVKNLAQDYRHPLKMSWCAGPGLVITACMTALMPGQAAITYVFATLSVNCKPDGSAFFRPFFVFPVLAILFVSLCLIAEIRSFSYASIPYIQHVKHWRVFGIKVSLYTWLVCALFMSCLGHWSDFYRALFAAESVICHEAGGIEDLWSFALSQSQFLYFFTGSSFRWMMLIPWMLDVFFRIPLSLLDGIPSNYFEHPIALHIPRIQDISCNRFDFIPWWTKKYNEISAKFPWPLYKAQESQQLVIKTGAAFFTFADTCGMGSIQNMTPSHALARAEEVLERLRKSATEDDESKGRLLEEAVQHLESIVPRVRNRALRALFSSACNVHMQISRLALVLSHQGRHFADDWGTYVSIFFSFAALVVAMYCVAVACYQWRTCMNTCEKVAGNIRMDVSMEMTCQRRRMMKVAAIIFLTMLISIHAIVTMIMATYFCPQAIWNVPLSWHLMDGCLVLPRE